MVNAENCQSGGCEAPEHVYIDLSALLSYDSLLAYDSVDRVQSGSAVSARKREVDTVPAAPPKILLRPPDWLRRLGAGWLKLLVMNMPT